MKYNSLQNMFSDIADAIREKEDSVSEIPAADFADRIRSFASKVVINSIPVQRNILVYSGNPITPEWDNLDTNLLDIQVDPQINVGEYVAIVTAKAGYKFSDNSTSKQIMWKINKLKLTKPDAASKEFTYNTQDQGPVVTGYQEKWMDQSGDTSATNANDYQIKYTLKDIKNTCWSDDSIEEYVISWTINRATPTLTLSLDTVSIKDNESQEVTINTNSDGQISISESTIRYASFSLLGNKINIQGVAAETASLTVKVSESSNYLERSTVLNIVVSTSKAEFKLDSSSYVSYSLISGQRQSRSFVIDETYTKDTFFPNNGSAGYYDGVFITLLADIDISSIFTNTSSTNRTPFDYYYIDGARKEWNSDNRYFGYYRENNTLKIYLPPVAGRNKFTIPETELTKAFDITYTLV